MPPFLAAVTCNGELVAATVPDSCALAVGSPHQLVFILRQVRSLALAVVVNSSTAAAKVVRIKGRIRFRMACLHRHAAD